MAAVLNRTTKEFRARANTPDFPTAQWIINPDLSAVAGFPSKYWTITGDVVTLMTLAERDAQDDADTTAAAAASEGEAELFGDGNDGDIVETVNRTLTQDIYPKLYTVDAGVIIDTAGFRIVAKKGAIINGVIRNNGGDAAGATGGAAGAAGSIGGGTAGSTGTNAAGTASANLNNDSTPGMGGRGGQAGNGSGGAGANGGQIRTDNNARTRPRRLDNITSMADVDNILGVNAIARFHGGTGGGAGGGGGGGNLGGGGGGGAGIVSIVAPIIFVGLTGAIEARGGAGGNGTGGNTGGGGGGGGGLIGTAAITFRERGARNVTGGAGGAGAGTGTAGVAGNNGRTVHLRINA